MQKKHTLYFVGYFLFILLLSSVAVAQQQTPAGVVVLDVRVEGTVTADQGLVIANSGLITGKKVLGDDIQKAIRRIWSLNLFSSVDIGIEKEAAGGAFFLIIVEEYPRLESISVEGNKKIKRREIEETLNLYKGQVLRPEKIHNAVKALQEDYKEKGYLLADIQVETVDTDEPNRKRLVLTVDEGKKVRIKKIVFFGNQAFKSKVLRKKMKDTKQKAIFRSGSFDKNEYRDDLDKVLNFYRNNGYRDITLVQDTISYTEDKKRMIIIITLNEGVLYTFGDVTFSGNTLFSNDELLELLAFKPGDTYSEEELQYTTSERLGNLYYDRGYIYSRMDPSITPDENNSLAIHYTVVEGNQFKVRKINILGNSKTKEKVIRREFTLYPGETFDVSKLRRSVREVTILNYFANIVPDVQPVNEDEVDLFIEVEEKPTDQANVAAGYSERDGMIGSVGFTMPNFLGGGQRFSLDWNFGTIYRSFSVSFSEPWLMNTPTLAGVSLFDMRRGGSWYGFDEAVTGGSVRLGRRFRWPDDYTRGDWIYKLESSTYSNFTDAFAASNPRKLQEDDPRWSSSITQIMTRDSRDNLEFPTRGSIYSHSFEVSGSLMGGDDQYVKQVVSGEWYFPLASRLVLYSHTKYGALTALSSDLADIPYIDYFFMGGSGLSFGEPLRGYEESQVGPRITADGFAIGGKSLFKQTLEARIPIIDNPTIFILGFFDSGNTWLTIADTDLNDLRRSAGFGMRLYMPFIGLIGLDYGYGFDYVGPDGRSSGQWVPHFQFGRTF